MKHPVLVRVFAVVLVIMCVISGAAGAVGFSDAKKERADGVSYGDKLDKRLENYKQLKEELDGSISYEDAMAELEKLQEQHDSDASQHRTDLATYSASRGGYKMGADALWEAKAQIAGAKQMIAQAKPMVAQMESAKAQLQQAIGLCDNAANACATCIGQLATAMQLINNPVTEPSEPPVVSPPPTTPVSPPGPMPEEPTQGEGESEEDFQKRLDEYQIELDQYNEDKKAYEDYEQAVTDYETYTKVTRPAYEAEKKKYDTWKTDLETEVPKAYAALGGCAAALQQGQGVLAGLGSLTSGGAATFSADGSGAGAIPGAGPDLTEMIEGITAMYTGLTQVNGGLGLASNEMRNAINEMDSKFMSSISQSGLDLPTGLSPSQVIAYAEEQIAKGEAEIQKNLENIWYELGELEKDKEKLEEDKGQLDEEASKLGRMIVSTDKLEELNNKFKSARAVLTNIGEIKTAVDAGESIEDAAACYIAQYRAETQTRFDTRCVICILAVAAGITGLTVIPAAFEKTKKRVWLILPAALCLGCAVAAEITCAASNLGQHYASIFTAVFAALYLLAALPKNKTGAAK